MIHKIELQDRQDTFTSFDNSRQRIVLDYVVSIGFEFHEGPIDLKTSDDHPLKIKYKNVGLEWDHSKQGLDAIGLVFDNVSFDIQDPGHWTLTGPLGELLRVVASRSGSGSNWMEVDLRFAIDLGIVTITGATIRASFDDSGNLSVELRGLQVKADIPDVLKGTGGVRLMPGGGIAANVDVQLEPITIEVEAQIVIDMPEVALEMGVLFAVGIPLANSGLGLYGFIGRFVVNGARTLTSHEPRPDPEGDRLVPRHARSEIRQAAGRVGPGPGRGHRHTAGHGVHVQRDGQHRALLPRPVGGAGNRRQVHHQAVAAVRGRRGRLAHDRPLRCWASWRSTRQR